MNNKDVKPGTVVKIIKSGNRFNAYDNDGNKHNYIATSTRSNAYDNKMALEYAIGDTGRGFWRQVPLADFEATKPPVTSTMNQEEIKNFIHSSYKLKPKNLMMKEVKWKYLVRSTVRGKPIMLTGMAGCGKTKAAQSVSRAFPDRPYFYFNLGATQDPRATLIGNTHFNPEDGTTFDESLFVTAIKTPNAIILLDEVSRAEPAAWNILMTVLDQEQRYLRLDEQKGQATVHVAEGVTFISTANIGSQYTATRVMDKAFVDRYIQIEMDILNDKEEFQLLSMMFPGVDKSLLKSVAEIAHRTRVDANSDDAEIESGISTRTSVQVAGLLFDGFSLVEAADVCIYPQYDNDGGEHSERTYVKQIVQRYIDDESEDVLFDTDEIDAARSN